MALGTPAFLVLGCRQELDKVKICRSGFAYSLVRLGQLAFSESLLFESETPLDMDNLNNLHCGADVYFDS